MGKLFLLFVAVPLVDLWLLLRIGRAIGPWPTVGLVILTGAAGAWLAKAEGLRVVRGWQAALSESRMPEEGVLSGLLVLAGGLLLVTPGVITDAAGLSLLFPPTRRIAARWLHAWARRKVDEGRIRVITVGPPHRQPDREIDVTPREPRGSP